MTTQTDIRANLPLTETTFFILLSLAPSPKHGYAIMKEVQILSEKQVVLSTGTLYGALKRLLSQGWIERVSKTEATSAEQKPADRTTSNETNETNETGRPRKAYRLTHLGQRILAAEVDRLQTLVTIARPRTVRGEI